MFKSEQRQAPYRWAMACEGRLDDRRDGYPDAGKSCSGILVYWKLAGSIGGEGWKIGRVDCCGANPFQPVKGSSLLSLQHETLSRRVHIMSSSAVCHIKLGTAA